MTPKYQLSVVVKYSKNCNLCLPPYKHFYSRSEEVTGIKINDEGRNEMQMIDYRKVNLTTQKDFPPVSAILL